jgi:spore cortex formation protein SpoVR/YcgB (stage V sporulation)
LLEDAGLEHDHIRLRKDEKWEELKTQLVKEGAHFCTLPYIEVHGRKFFRTIPIMRYISVKLDYKYHGSTPEDNEQLDVIAELTDLWFNSMKVSFFGSDVSHCANICMLQTLLSNIKFIGTKGTPY